MSKVVKIKEENSTVVNNDVKITSQENAAGGIGGQEEHLVPSVTPTAGAVAQTENAIDDSPGKSPNSLVLSEFSQPMRWKLQLGSFW